MAKKKFYAVKSGVKPGIYETWAECEAQTKGFSGAQFKSFGSMAEAEAYMTGAYIEDKTTDVNNSVDEINNQVEEEISKLTENDVIAFVDGSYSSVAKKSGFGVIILDDKGIQTHLYKAFTEQYNTEFLEFRNVAAELEGVKEAVKWAIAYKKENIKIYYDYEGIGKWADGSWKAKKNLTRKYVAFIKEKRAFINIEFCKVSAHSGIEYNEMADKLAKNSLLEKGYKTYNDGSIYFVGFSGDDWKTIIECINEENEELGVSDKETVNIDVNVNGSKQRILATDSRNKVVINCYSNRNSYVQGKQSVLFQKVISLAIELMKNEHTVIETLNHIHVLTITQEEVEIKFEQLLPHYNGTRSEKHYNNLLSAVYNTMLTGYMPDYTSLITPIFRAYEYYLHRILGDIMELNTCNANGKNNFSYFNKNDSGRFECNSNSLSRLTYKQQEFLNDLYNAYHNIRHPYSHWSADDYDTAVITTIDTARDYLLKGLTLVDKYYTLF
ncbi:viroplasmin family protein [Eubacterium sp. AF19-12LB]|uniref:ribonuclease H1 domain-containing protein n=1 Tax=Eubacterium sp. AF19-12LB TaxID=2293106 RepID=UPI000E54FFD8|nr:viroplasmin family protein [Eubacterium sp. AF19-12LB]RHR33795.1 ribonuclease HI [Eubacterium sp. AF19-12LB]